MSNETTTEQVICAICGKADPLHWNEAMIAELKQHQMCFDCNFWREKAEWRRDGNPKAAVIEGDHYMVEPMVTDGTPKGWLGYGGRLWKVRWFDGRVVETNNLWRQGTVPERHWRELLPDNAEFVREGGEL